MIDNGSSLDVASVSYDSFGNPTYNESQVGTFRNFYAGREYDDFTGLYYNRARWYDPQATRFISQDPISFAGGDTNLYRYAGNSPDNATDPSGNIIPLIVWAGFAVAGVGAGVTNYYANEADIATGGNCYIPGLTEDRGAIRQIDQERYQDAMAGVGAGLAITGLGASLIAAPALGAALGSGSTLLAADGAIFSGLYGSTNAYAQGADGWGIATAGATHAAFGAVLGPTLGFAGRVASPYIGRAGAYAGEQLLVGASRVAPKTTQSLALSSTLYVNAYRYGLNSSAGAYAAAQGRFFLRPSVTMQSARVGAFVPQRTASGVFSDARISWTATRPRGTGLTYDVIQRTDINWERVRVGGVFDGRGLTNAEAARRFGLAPELDDGFFATLHHVRQDARGPLVEASRRYHGVGRPGHDSIHSIYGLRKPHPTRPVDHRAFAVDTGEYWRWRAPGE